MSYNFNTIDGLFRPNYLVYKPYSDEEKTKSKISDPIRVIYNPLDIQRVKTILTETPTYESPAEDIESPNTTQYEVEVLLLPDLEYFISELDKFITKNPEYKPIKTFLLYLAELESKYKLSEENYLGSGALGWFLFMDSTRNIYNNQTREEFAKDPQALLLTAAQYYTDLLNNIRRKGGDPNDFVTMYGAWWRPNSAYLYIKNPNHDFKTKYNESFQLILQRARNVLNKYE